MITHLKKGDTVKIITGKDRGKTGKVLKVFGEKSLVSVDGVNVYKKHVKPKKQGEKGEVINLSRPLKASNAQLVCPSCSKSVRIGFRLEGEKKVRYCKKCNASI